jgi:hypothetical protein
LYFFIGGGAFFTSRGEQLAALALRYAVPTASAEFYGRTAPLTMASSERSPLKPLSTATVATTRCPLRPRASSLIGMIGSIAGLITSAA